MIDDPDHPEFQRAQDELVAAVRSAFLMRMLTPSLMQDLNSLIYRHRTKWRQRGVDLPPISALIVPRIGAMMLVRSDLDAEGVATQVVNMSVRHPDATAAELAQAVRLAFPDTRPGDLVDAARAASPHLRRNVQ